jgi:hypothetical protein
MPVMNKVWIIMLLLTACGDRSQRKTDSDLSTADSTIIRYQPDTGPLVDTDDHNKPSQEGIVLDSPVGPDKGMDSVLANPEAKPRR